MSFTLRIPYAEKDAAKQVARDAGSPLWYSDGLWTFHGNTLPKELKRYVVADAAAPATTAANTKTAPVKRTTTANSERFTYVLDLPFMQREMSTTLSAYFDKEHKTFLSTAESKVLQYPQYLSQPYSYEAWLEQRLNKRTRAAIIQQYATEDLMTPRDYQNVALKHIAAAYKAKLSGFLLADEVGLGKTISAALTAQMKEFKTILVVTTLSAVAHWRKTFLKFKLKDKEIVIINYDRLQKLFTHDNSKYKKAAKTRRAQNKRLAKNGEAPEFDLVIFDESHKLRNPTTMRTKLAMKIRDEADFTLYMSATAGQNPLELSYLAPLLAEITGDKVANLTDFEKWCVKMDLGVKRGAFGKWEWDGSQESIDKVHTLLFKGKIKAALRRTPADIEGYPEITRALTPFELSSEERESYDLAWSEFKQTMLGYSGKRIGKGESNNILVAKLRLRQKASILKTPYTYDLASDLLENGHQVAISVAFKETLFDLQERFEKDKQSVALIHGELSAKQKEAERMRFQTGDAKIVIFTVEEAISLHQGEYNDAPRSMLIQDLRWSAISMSQIEGRTHRDGKFSQAYWLYFTDTIEEDIANIVLNRIISMKGMIGDDTETLKAIEAVLAGKTGE